MKREFRALPAAILFLSMPMQTINFTVSVAMIVVGVVIWTRMIIKEFKKLHTNN